MLLLQLLVVFATVAAACGAGGAVVDATVQLPRTFLTSIDSAEAAAAAAVALTEAMVASTAAATAARR